MKANDQQKTKERRSLVEGLTASSNVDRTVEHQFVFAGKQKATDPVGPDAPTTQAKEAKAQLANPVTRTPLTTRIRADYAAALKRASLERQLSGTTPNTLQDILEEALEPWLRTNGYLTPSHQ
jgi:hypothetical protein